MRSTRFWNPRSFTSNPGEVVRPATPHRQFPATLFRYRSALTPASAVRVGALEVAVGRALHLLQRGGFSLEVGTADAAGQRVTLVAPALEEVEAAGERVARQHVERRRRGPPVHGGGEQPDARVAAVHVPLDAAGEVVGRRLDLVTVARPRHRVEDGGALAGGDGIEQSHGPTGRRAPAEFGRAENGGALRDVLEGAARGWLPLRRPPDAPGIEIQRQVAEMAHAAAVPAEVEDLGALDEERPVLV